MADDRRRTASNHGRQAHPVAAGLNHLLGSEAGAVGEVIPAPAKYSHASQRTGAPRPLPIHRLSQGRTARIDAEQLSVRGFAPSGVRYASFLLPGLQGIADCWRVFRGGRAPVQPATMLKLPTTTRGHVQVAVHR